jgi:hypothetical protein
MDIKVKSLIKLKGFIEFLNNNASLKEVKDGNRKLKKVLYSFE